MMKLKTFCFKRLLEAEKIGGKCIIRLECIKGRFIIIFLNIAQENKIDEPSPLF